MNSVTHELPCFSEPQPEVNPETIPAAPAFPENQEETPAVREVFPEEVDPQMQVNPEGKDSDFNN